MAAMADAQAKPGVERENKRQRPGGGGAMGDVVDGVEGRECETVEWKTRSR